MRRLLCVVMILLAFTGIACPPTPTVNTSKKDDPKPPPPIETPNELKTRIEGALEHVRSRALPANKFWTVFHGILGSGLERTVIVHPKTKEKVNAIQYICDGGEIRGMEFVPTEHGLDVRTSDNPMMEGTFQGHQDQFIAEMAQWGMPKDKKFKVGKDTYTFEAFVRHSKMRASVKQKPPQELSWAIIIIAQYYGADHEWTNAAGETLNFNDVVRHEVDATINEAACGGTHRLFGMTWAYHLHLKNGGQKTGVWVDVANRIDEYKEFARKYQSPDRSLSTLYFKGPDANPDKILRISTTGHIVEWLALAMTDDELKSMWMQEAVSSLALTIIEMSDKSIDSGALYHAAHGLQLYHDRVFGKSAPYVPLPKKS